MKKVVGICLVLFGVVIMMYVFYTNSSYSDVTRTFSPYTLISSSWEKYKQTFINEDGRVLDFSQDEITTSEGQSYAMLRAVWVDDKETFDKVWQWTKDNLRREEDNLFGWKWGQKDDGSYGFLADGGENNASDADSDIALALILASRRWNNAAYREEAKSILQDLWERNVAEAAGKNYFIAGNWAQSTDTLVLNPSYFSPYAWRIFAQVDTDRDWESLITPAYDLLEAAGKTSLDQQNAVGLPPDWVAIDRETGQLKAPEPEGLKTNYSFDAVRVPWRIALDYFWNKEERAYNYLKSSFTFLEKEYEQKGKLATSYSHSGEPVIGTENPVMYATSLGYFMISNPTIAEDIYEEKLIRLYSNASNNFNENLPYYEMNWLWFGIALYNNYLVPFEG